MNNSNLPEAAARLELDLREAINLRLMLLLRERDKSYERGEREKFTTKKDTPGQVFYAIDANVLNEYFTPVSFEENSLKEVDSSFKIFAGPVEEITDTDEADDLSEYRKAQSVEADFGRVVIRKILHELGGKFPLILLPGHDREARRLYDRVVDDFDGQVTRGREVKNVLRRYMKKLSSAKTEAKRLEVAERWEDRLRDALFDLSDAHDKFFEYNSLLRDERLVKLDLASRMKRFSHLKRDDDKHIFRAHGLGFSKLRQGSAKWWNDKLNPFIPANYLARDEKALTTLDRINRLLRPHNSKVVLITTNQRIIDAGAQYYPYRYDSERASRYSFTDLYLRHPSFLIADSELLNVDVDEEDGEGEEGRERDGATSDTSLIEDWLDPFLAPVTSGEHYDVLAFHESVETSSEMEGGVDFADLATKLVQEDENLHKKFFGRWFDFLDEVNLAHVSSSKLAVEAIIDKLGEKLVESEEGALAELDSYMRQRTEDSWREFFLSALDSGYHLIDTDVRGRPMVRRNVPPIVLRGMGEAEKLVAAMAETDGIINNRQQILKLLGELDASDADESDYIKTLCYALLFAHADRWSITELVALRAAKIAASLKKRHGSAASSEGFGLVTGREAHYLAAVAIRLTAKNKQGLLPAKQHVERARTAQHVEEEDPNQSIANKNYAKLTGLRFGSEDIAIEVAELLFDFLNGEREGEEFGSSKHFSVKCRALRNKILALLKSSEECEDDQVRSQVRVALRGNLFSVLMLLEYSLGALEPTHLKGLKNLVADQVKDLKKVRQTSPGLVRLSVLDTYLLSYAASLIGTLNSTLPFLSLRMKRVSRINRDREELLVMPYDRKRFGFIIEMIEKHRKAAKAEAD